MKQYIALTRGNRNELMIEVLRGDDKAQVTKDAITALGVFEDDPRYAAFKNNLIVMTVLQALGNGFI